MTGSSSTRFLCVTASGDRESACFEISIPEEIVCRSDVLQTAIDAGEEPVQLLLPQAADCHFFDAWIQLVQALRDRLILAQSMPMRDVLRGLLVRIRYFEFHPREMCMCCPCPVQHALMQY